MLGLSALLSRILAGANVTSWSAETILHLVQTPPTLDIRIGTSTVPRRASEQFIDSLDGWRSFGPIQSLIRPDGTVAPLSPEPSVPVAGASHGRSTLLSAQGLDDNTVLFVLYI